MPLPPETAQPSLKFRRARSYPLSHGTWHHNMASRHTSYTRTRPQFRDARRTAIRSLFLAFSVSRLSNRLGVLASATLVRPVAPLLATLSRGRSPVSTVTTLVRHSSGAGSVTSGGGARGTIASVASRFGPAAVRRAVAGCCGLAARGAVTLKQK